MKLIKKALFTFVVLVLGLPNFCIFNLALADDNPYDAVLRTTIRSSKSGAVGGSLESVISNPEDIITDKTGGDLVNEQVKLLIQYVIDIFIVVGIAIAFIGGYKIMTKHSDENMKEGIRFLVFGMLGIIIMVSARFLAEGLVGDDGVISSQFVGVGEDPNGIIIAQNVYEKVLYPFIKMALYLVVGALFFMMATKVITFVISTEETAKKHAGGIILWCAVGILVVMGSKQIVEAVMGNQEEVLNKDATRITGGENGVAKEILEFNSIPLIAQVLNWVMGLAMFVILVLIIIQGYRMFAKPDDPKNRERLKKTMLYIIIGVLVIGASYIVSNLLVVNGFTEAQL